MRRLLHPLQRWRVRTTIPLRHLVTRRRNVKTSVYIETPVRRAEIRANRRLRREAYGRRRRRGERERVDFCLLEDMRVVLCARDAMRVLAVAVHDEEDEKADDDEERDAADGATYNRPGMIRLLYNARGNSYRVWALSGYVEDSTDPVSACPWWAEETARRTCIRCV